MIVNFTAVKFVGIYSLLILTVDDVMFPEVVIDPISHETPDNPNDSSIDASIFEILSERALSACPIVFMILKTAFVHEVAVQLNLTYPFFVN